MGKKEDDSPFDNDFFEIKLWDKEKINRQSGLWFIQLITLLKKNFILQVYIIIIIIILFYYYFFFKFHYKNKRIKKKKSNNKT